jgi:hypothetical protein
VLVADVSDQDLLVIRRPRHAQPLARDRGALPDRAVDHGRRLRQRPIEEVHHALTPAGSAREEVVTVRQVERAPETDLRVAREERDAADLAGGELELLDLAARLRQVQDPFAVSREVRALADVADLADVRRELVGREVRGVRGGARDE